MNRDQFELAYSCRIVQWAEFNGECYQFSALQRGRFVVADSLELLAIELSPVQLYAIAA